MKQLTYFNRKFLVIVICLCCLCLTSSPIYSAPAAQPPLQPELSDPAAQAGAKSELKPEPKIVELGNDRYRIGEIEIDKASKTFSISGVVLRTEPPLEFLVSTKGGSKGYESLLEVNANAFEFNLACILIGLDPKQGVAASFHFAPEPAQGDPVALWVSWQKKGKIVRVPAAKLLLEGNSPVKSDEWVYTGSIFTTNGKYMAEIDGTLVGFVHDPASIIEHKYGIALGNYGDVLVRPDLLPPVGSKITLHVENLEDKVKQ